MPDCRCGCPAHADICACGCPEYRPSEPDLSVLSDEDWELVHGEFMNMHAPAVLIDEDALEVHYLPPVGAEADLDDA